MSIKSAHIYDEFMLSKPLKISYDCKTLFKTLWELRDSDAFTDLEFVADNVSIKLHSIVACCSCILPSQSKVIKIDYADNSYEDLLQVVKYMYGQDFDVTQKNIFTIYRIAEYLHMDEFIVFIIDVITSLIFPASQLSSEFILKVINFEKEFKNEKLKNAYQSYLCMNPEIYSDILFELDENILLNVINEYKLYSIDFNEGIIHIGASFIKKFSEVMKLKNLTVESEENKVKATNFKEFFENYINQSHTRGYIGFPDKLYRSVTELGAHPGYTSDYRSIETGLTTCTLSPLEWQLSNVTFYLLDYWDGRSGMIGGFQCEYLNYFTDERKTIAPFEFDFRNSVDLNLDKYEYIYKIEGYTGWVIDRLQFFVSTGRKLDSIGAKDGGGHRLIDLLTQFERRNVSGDAVSDDSCSEIDDKMIGLFGFDFDIIRTQFYEVCNRVRPVFSAIPKPKCDFLTAEKWKSLTYKSV